MALTVWENYGYARIQYHEVSEHGHEEAVGKDKAFLEHGVFFDDTRASYPGLKLAPCHLKEERRRDLLDTDT